jgi:hypothetical protein
MEGIGHGYFKILSPSLSKETENMKEKSGLQQPVAERNWNRAPPEYESDALSMCQPPREK